MNKNTTPNMSEIQIWNKYDAVSISEDAMQNKLLIKVDNDAIALPFELENKIQNTWQEIASKKPVVDNPILFLKKPLVRDGDLQTIETNVRGFRYTQAFNRTEEYNEMIAELNAYKLLSLSTHVHLLTKDGKLIYGTKKNQFNQISGFSGFPNALEDLTKNNNQNYLDVYKTIRNRLNGEMGYLVDAVRDINAVGVVYVNTPKLRGLDTDYLVKLDETAEGATKRFQESFQFSKELHVVDFHPDKIVEFVNRIHENGKIMSKYALGCQYLIMNAYFGEKEATKLLTAVRKLGITMSTENETEYFY